jgi:hypothetical protein
VAEDTTPALRPRTYLDCELRPEPSGKVSLIPPHSMMLVPASPQGFMAVAEEEIGVTRIQFRLPDGAKVLRRFLLNEPIEHLYKYIHTKVSDVSCTQP